MKDLVHLDVDICGLDMVFFKVIQIWKASTCINYTTFKRCNIIEYDWKQVYIFLKHVVTMATQLLGLGMQWFLFQYV